MNNKTKWTIIFGIIIILFISIVTYIFVNKKNKYTPLYNRKDTDIILKNISNNIYGSKSTPIYVINNFLSDSECDDIIFSIKNKLVKSPLTRQDPNDPNFRTSKTGYFSDNNDIHNMINNKIIKTIKIPNNLSEIPQVQKYEVGNEFKAHWDAFDPEVDKSFYDKGQRTWTFMIYLNDVEEGGETYFTKLNERIIPKKGKAVIWCNIKENYDIDRNTMHRGSPVKKGEKYIITKWFKLQKNKL